MKNIFKIYNRDLQNIITNWVAIVVMLGLMILPSLYAWFNIKSSWDPYSNTKSISVAVVNKDKAAFFKGQSINVGEELVNKLKINKNIGWKFVDEKEAEKGVKYGKYYASIMIPEDFSYKILSITRDKQEKPTLIYSVNEKSNAVAPKITSKGVTTIQSEVTKTFVKTVNGIIFEMFNKLGIELEKGKPKLKDLMNMIFYVNDKIPEINASIDKLEKGAITLEEFIEKINKDIPLIKDTINSALSAGDKTKLFLSKSKEGINNVAPYIKQDLIIARKINSTAEVLIEEGVDLIGKNSSKARENLLSSKDKLTNVKEILNSILELIDIINKDKKNIIMNDFENNIKNMKERVNNKIENINTVISSIDRGEKVSVEALNRLNNKANGIDSILEKTIEDFNPKIVPAINNVLNDLIVVADNTIQLLKNANENLPGATELLDKGYTGAEKGIKGIKILKSNLPSIEKSIGEVSNKLKTLDDDERLNEIIKLMKSNAKIESDFISNPVEIKENRIYPIPNYGSAMAPFFTTLSLWVGALILVSILSVEVKDIKGAKKLKVHEKYFGRYFTFMTIAIFQALIVSLGDIYLLKVYVSNKSIFILFSIFISIIFSMIIYTLVSVFGNVGKALGVILLVLQISASGGTFPIEVTPGFFQRINPLLPFTYSVSGMREAVGGVIEGILLRDIIILLIYFTLSILLALLLKKKLEKANKNFVKKFKESGLVEE
ncbi:YhgE/Pip domain-containing protein [Clostridium botulinum]|uniref:Membrane protein n=1 Tax=Clostridium botulinum (strain Hall / ATCC 3502 / NCTC 13319 / Type A) TaxID=441771 RepID=A5I609_CLOBH|nr:YhgE/Pip domain-containing protein [Clostridium botulinum]ABS35251.1 putative phage infection protein [Clostridium botulinum A str. ATCC 19397]ABS36197.1 putative phage infection protein [Clostridium botulinum A str. Hall]AWB18738.1 YhgE/Pip domain-containing protein [Clostridium botulinum]EGT5616176.1 YhgE/Pip domain-containing protein [Clostridium botulinum]EGT5621229.1 YhgE/Pip domain-containing protein [Clostridium botulinum]